MVAGWGVVGCVNNSKKMKYDMLPYPATAMVDTVDNYHGTPVSDPYRWLEDDNSASTADWVRAQNQVTFHYLDQIPFREAIRSRLSQLWNYEKIGTPFKIGDYYFYYRNDGLQNQSVLYMKKGLDGEPQVFLDPNTLSQDGTVALGGTSYSLDGRYMAYSLAASGSDWVKIYIKEIPSGRVLDDCIEWVKFSGAAWDGASEGFYYSRYDKPQSGSELSAQNSCQKIYYHKVGERQEQDRLIYADLGNPLRYFNAEESEDGRWLFIGVSEGTSGSELLFRRLNTVVDVAGLASRLAAAVGIGSNFGFGTLCKGFEYDYSIVECKDDTAYVYTNDSAPNYRLVAIDLNHPERGMKNVIAENPDRLLEGVSSVGGVLMAKYLVDATSRVYQYAFDGTLVRQVELPVIGTASGFGGRRECAETFFSLSTYIAPPSVYKYDLASGSVELYAAPQVSYDPNDYTVEQQFFTSKDGTRVPMFLMHRKDLELNGKNPVYLYGYGGFNINLTPSFSSTMLAFAEQGGVYAVVNLRGGGEYGERWHKAGMLANKQNVFDDFIAAAEYLIAEGYTSRDKLAIGGGSNGGLLVGACMTQRPDLYAVALPAVGVMDMLRYHLFTCGWGWAVEYGSSDNADQFEYIYKYSPLHNIRDGVKYPATMITTADHDDRVVPAHSFKFAARLQQAQGGDAPILIRIDTDAGHGAGKPTAKRIADATDMLSFIFANTDTEYNK